MIMKLKSKEYDRRELFKMFGGSALLLHPLMGARAAENEGKAIKRLLIMHTPNGVSQKYFWPSGNSGNYNFKNRGLDPLTKYIDDLVVLKGVTVNRDRYDAHISGMVSLLTGNLINAAVIKNGKLTKENSDRTSKNASIDQIYANTIGKQTEFASLNLGACSWEEVFQRYMSYDENGSPRRIMNNPYEVYKLLASSIGCKIPGSFIGDDLTILKRQSMLDTLMADLKSASARVGLGSEEKIKLEDYMESLRKIEKDLANSGKADGPECASLAHIPDNPKVNGNLSTFTKAFPHMMDLIVVAFKLDLTRVITLNVSVAGRHGPSYEFLKVGGKPIKSVHHTISHMKYDPTDWAEKLNEIDKWHATQFGGLIGRLKDIKEGDSNILHNSVAMWTSELGDGTNHSQKNTPFIIAGTGNGAFKTKRYITTNEASHHGRLLDVLKAVGVNRTSLGNSGNNPTRFL